MLLVNSSCLQDGKYRIIQALGQGGFGITYEAEQVALHRRVAIKEFFMKEYCDRDSTTSHVTLGTSEGSKELVEKFRAKFVREAQMIAGLDNPHIIKIHDIFEENGTAYYVMPFLDGGSLADKVKRNGPMPEQEAIGYIKQIGNALDYLHKQNILHLDVKPSNVLLNSAGEAVLIDFGISKHYDEAGSQTSTTPVGISKGYAPMEQYQQGNMSKFSPATDIYSLGATLYFLLTGQTPPEAAEVYEDGIPEIPRISKATNKAIAEAMSPKRKDRPQSIGSFLSLFVSISSSNEESPNFEPQIIGVKDNKNQVRDEATVFVKPEIPQHQHEEVPPKSNSSIAKGNKTLIILLTVLAVLIIAVFVFNGQKDNAYNNAQREDVIYLDEARNRSCSFDSDGGNISFSLTKTFNEDIEHEALPTWCSVQYGYQQASITISCDANTTDKIRTAKILFHKKGAAKAIATVSIAQTGVVISTPLTREEPTNATRIEMQDTGLIEGAEVGEQFSLDYSITPKEAKGHKVSWSSSNPSVASVNSQGIITVKGIGKTTIKVKVDNVSASCIVEVRNLATTKNTSSTDSNKEEAMSISKTSVSILVGQATALVAYHYGSSLKWESDNPQVATVSQNGVVTGKMVGSAMIYARGTTESKSCLVFVRTGESSHSPHLNKTTLGIYEGSSAQLSVLDYSGNVKWSSDDLSIATVSSDGLVKGVMAGKTFIWANYGNETQYCLVTVNHKDSSSSSRNTSAEELSTDKPMSISKASVSIYTGETIKLEAFNFGPSLSWVSEDSSIAIVSSTGSVTGLKEGNVWIYAKGRETKKCLVTVLANRSILSRVISGRITDTEGNPMIGAAVLVVGTRSGTVTDINGEYSIRAKTGDQLSVTYKKYTCKNQTVGKEGNTINFTMQRK